MATFKVEAWSLKSPAAGHEDRILTASRTVEAKTEDEARIVAAREAGIPRDYWDGVRASSVGLRTAPHPANPRSNALTRRVRDPGPM